MTNSIRKMLESKEAKRADAVKVRYESIHIEPGFNLRRPGPKLEESIERLTDYIAGGGRIPPLEVWIRDDGGVWVVDGHRRHSAIGRALERGVPLRSEKDGQCWVDVTVFEGNDIDRNARVMSSAEGEPLEPIEIAEGYKRFRAWGMTTAQIAARMHKSSEHVLQMLALGDSDSGVHAMVAAGAVSASTAAKVARASGSKAAKILSEKLEELKAEGKTRIKPSDLVTPGAKASDLRADSKRLEFLIAEGVCVCQGSRSDLATPEPGQRGFWLEWPSGATQPGIFETARLAIDTAIKQQITT